MTEQTLITKETSTLVDMGSIVPASAGDLAGITAELNERRTEAEAAEIEIASLTKSYDDEVADHLETAKRAFVGDRMLAALWELLVNELGFEKDPTKFFNGDEEAETELRDAIIGAQVRVKAAADNAAKHAAKKALATVEPTS